MATMKKKVNPLWGGRFKTGASDLAQSFSSSVDIDKNLFEVDIKGSVAYAEILKEAKVINAKDLSKIKKGLNKILLEIREDRFNWDPALEDVHMNIESRLAEIAGASAKKLHTGRSRNDQVATDLRLFLMIRIDEILQTITSLQKSILEQADKNYDVLLPGFTHLQIAQPVTLGHHLMAWYEMLSRDYSRLIDTKKRMDVMPLGSAALSGTRFNIDRKFLAKKLGFSEISRNSMDAVSDRDFVCDFAYTCSMTMMHLSRISEELVFWMNSHIKLVDIDEAFCTGSSIMPQKKNPDVPELVRGKSGAVIGSLTSLFVLLKGLPLTYNRDLQEDKSIILEAIGLSLIHI